MTFTAPRSKHTSVDHGRITISLPQMPFDVPPAVTDETAPRSRMVTCGYDWRKDPVLRSADGKAGAWRGNKTRAIEAAAIAWALK